MFPDVQLSKREKEVLNLLLRGNSNKQIALSLDIAIRNVEFHLKNIYAKLQVNSRIELLLKLALAKKIEAGSIHRRIGLHLEMLSR